MEVFFYWVTCDEELIHAKASSLVSSLLVVASSSGMPLA